MPGLVSPGAALPATLDRGPHWADRWHRAGLWRIGRDCGGDGGCWQRAVPAAGCEIFWPIASSPLLHFRVSFLPQRRPLACISVSARDLTTLSASTVWRTSARSSGGQGTQSGSQPTAGGRRGALRWSLAKKPVEARRQ